MTLTFEAAFTTSFPSPCCLDGKMSAHWMRYTSASLTSTKLWEFGLPNHTSTFCSLSLTHRSLSSAGAERERTVHAWLGKLSTAHLAADHLLRYLCLIRCGLPELKKGKKPRKLSSLGMSRNPRSCGKLVKGACVCIWAQWVNGHSAILHLTWTCCSWQVCIPFIFILCKVYRVLPKKSFTMGA